MKTVWVLYRDYDYEGYSLPLEVFSRPPSLKKLTKAIKAHGFVDRAEITARRLLDSKYRCGTATYYEHDMWYMDKYNVS